MIRAIYRHELLGVFRTPVAWMLLGFSAGLIAFQFLSQLDFYLTIANKLKSLEEPPGVTSLIVTPLITFSAMLLIFLVPIVTMASINGERRTGTLQLVASSPVSMGSLVAAKFLSYVTLFLALWVILATMVLSLFWGTTLDLGLCAGGLLALCLYTASAVSVGIAVSALVRHPPAAGALSLVVLLFLWFCDWASRTTGEANLFTWLSAERHFTRIANGLFDSFDVAYFFVITFFALGLAYWRLANERYLG
ncbi:MAG: ABC transporter permease subunit [Pseudomonadota bacterium]